MSAERAWKPGNVAAVKCSDGEWRQATCEPHSNWPDVFAWRFPDRVYRHMDSEARPLVVIDPEDRDDVQRVCDALYANGSPRFGVELDWLNVQDALRSLIEPPAPPRPPEPTGLGAVVEDEDGGLWTRVESGDAFTRNPWYPAEDAERQPDEYKRINAVKVLSAGVES